MADGQENKEPGVVFRRSRVVERSPVYYGWLVLAAATLGMIMTGPGQTFGVSVFLDPIIAELGLTRSTVSLLYTVGTLVGAFSLPFVGRFIDLQGPRKAVIIISALFALACVWMGFVTGLTTLLIGFVLIRGLGQGSLSLVSLHVINIWFVRRRGLAIGINGLGVALATALLPLGIQLLLDAYGWRSAYIILGVMVAAVMIPIGATFFRSHPETYGLIPDGRLGGPRSMERHGPEEVSYTLQQARRTVTFWLFVTGDFMVAGLGTGLVFHHYSIMATGGVDRLAASTFFLSLGLVSAGAVLVTGYLMDRLPPRLLLSLSQALLAGAIVLAGFVATPTLTLVYGGLLGLSQGMKGAIGGSVYGHYFGRRHVGAIKGSAVTITIAGTAVGPFLYGLGYDLSGTYLPVLFASALLPAAVALAAPFLAPRKADGTVF